MLSGVKESAALIEGIATASQHQSGAISEATTAIREMDKMTQHNAALVEETNAAIEQTEGQAHELDRIVEVFVLHAANSRSDREIPAGRPSPAATRTASLRPKAAAYVSQGNAAVKQDWSEF